MAYAASQVAIFTEPDDYVLENNADVIYVHVLDRFDFNLKSASTLCLRA